VPASRRAQLTGVMSIVALAFALAVTAAPAAAATTYGAKAGEWSKRFTFNGCQMRVKWGIENGSGVARARFYTRALAHCRSAADSGAGPGWMGALAGESSGIPLVYPGKRSAGTRKDACGTFTEWKATAPQVTGLQLNLVNNGRLVNPYFRIEASGRPLPHAVRC
jgi:hypothetical protein